MKQKMTGNTFLYDRVVVQVYVERSARSGYVGQVVLTKIAEWEPTRATFKPTWIRPADTAEKAWCILVDYARDVANGRAPAGASVDGGH